MAIAQLKCGGNPLDSLLIYSMASVCWLCDGMRMLAVSSAPYLYCYVWCTHNSRTFRFGTNCLSRQPKCPSYFGSAICDTGSITCFKTKCVLIPVCAFIFLCRLPLFTFVWPNMDIEGIVHLKCGGVANRFKLPGLSLLLFCHWDFYQFCWCVPLVGLWILSRGMSFYFELLTVMCMFETGIINLAG